MVIEMFFYVAGGFLLLLVGLWAYSVWTSRRIERRYPPVGDFVEVAGVRLHYQRRGALRDGVAPVVLIHGASGNLRDMMNALGDRLGRETSVIAFDRPGHGWSERGWSGRGADMASPAAQARLIRQAVRDLGIERPVILGHSWGGAVAAAYAIEFGDEISGIVPLSGALYPWPGGNAWYHDVIAMPVIGSLFLRILMTPAAQLLAPAGVMATFRPNDAPAGYAEAIGLPMIFRAGEFGANSEDVRNLKENLAAQSERYDEILAPVIVVTGNADFTVSPKIHSYAFHNAVTGSELVKLKGVGHMPHYERCEVVADAVLRLARGQAPRPGEVTVWPDDSVEIREAAD
ncbi:pimeloyl-ACP methyl ester carboxylesterase [Parvibaculum indicum]|uniref:alpha/beta fold hydrolase n=1 Tax=Parvibaculum indicum TaxID=562969 RepID=UPI001421685E|nr:alpha/beta hydrolase [Parvibaculum indicum]NIJ40535.1 pimeloyl-ACP methyl ester carboxylesterase [Parvibaculum indicum]